MTGAEYSPADGPADLSDEERRWWRKTVRHMIRTPLPSDLLQIRAASTLNALIGQLLDVMRGTPLASDVYDVLLDAIESAMATAARIEQRLRT